MCPRGPLPQHHDPGASAAPYSLDLAVIYEEELLQTERGAGNDLFLAPSPGGKLTLDDAARVEGWWPGSSPENRRQPWTLQGVTRQGRKGTSRDPPSRGASAHRWCWFNEPRSAKESQKVTLARSEGTLGSSLAIPPLVCGRFEAGRRQTPAQGHSRGSGRAKRTARASRLSVQCFSHQSPPSLRSTNGGQRSGSIACLLEGRCEVPPPCTPSTTTPPTAESPRQLDFRTD